MATFKVLYYGSKKLTDGTSPVLLRIIHERRPYYLTLSPIFKCTKEQWDEKECIFRRNFPEYKKANVLLQQYKAKTSLILLDFEQNEESFSIDMFKKRLFNRDKRLSLKVYFDALIEKFEKIEDIGNAKVYKTTRNAILRFNENKDIELHAIKIKFLNDFEFYLRGAEKKDTTIRNYMSTFRALFNRARKEEGLKNYPFNEYDFEKLNLQTSKRALKKDVLGRIFNYQVKEGTKEYDALNYFKFMYAARGMNFVDFAYLKYSDIKDGYFEYRRKKGGKLFKIYIIPPMDQIIEYYRTNDKTYVFPILNETYQTEKSRKNKVQASLKHFNNEIRNIAADLGISAHITSYVTRHSWATILKREKESTTLIGEGMGHDIESTTNIYLDEFENEDIIAISKKAVNLLR